MCDLKNLIVSSPIVQPYSLAKEVTLTCDASETNIDAVLSQEGLPIMYISKALTLAEQKYANIEREALSIVYVVKRAEKLLAGRHFTIRTDHRPLQFIFGEHKEIPKSTSARLQRWAILLMSYDYSIEYVPGEQVPHADALSRLEFSYGHQNYVFEDLDIGVHWTGELGATWENLVIETEADKVLKRVKERITRNRWSNITPCEQPYKRNRDALTVENEVVLLGTRPVIPEKMRKQVMAAAHQGHFGMVTTKLRIRKNAMWKDLLKVVGNVPGNRSRTSLVSSFRGSKRMCRFDEFTWIGRIFLARAKFSSWLMPCRDGPRRSCARTVLRQPF